MPIRFSEWRGKLQKEHERISSVPLSEVSEVMCLDSSSIVVSIGKKYCAEINGVEYGIGNLREFYTHHKDEFANLLESITEQSKGIAVVTETLLEAVTADSMPELIMDRLQGGGAQDPVDMVKELAKKRLNELWKIWNRQYPSDNFRIELEVAGKTLGLCQGDYVIWGNIIVRRNMVSRTDNVEECLFFVSQYDEIKAKVKQVSAELMRLGKHLNE